jgi:hypothetical protein
MPKSNFETATFDFGIPKSNAQSEEKFPICEPISSPENGNLSDAVNSGQWRQVDYRGASRSVSLCQIGLRWLSERRNLGFLPPLFSGCFKPLEAT